MARNKEALLLLLDVGPSMHDIVPEIAKVCSMLVQKKLVFGRQDEVGVVLFGTEETKNELTEEVGGYEHVVVLQQMKVVDGDLVEILQQLPQGTVSGDFIDGVVVGLDMLIKKFGITNKGKKRVCLITDAIHPIKQPYEGTKEDQVNTIASQMIAHGIKMDCVVFRGKRHNNYYADKKIVMEENDRLLNIFSRITSAKTVHVESSTSLLGALRTRNISPVTIFRGDFEISSNLKMKVWVYKKTSEDKFPTLKKYSDTSPATDNFATHEIKVDFEHKSVGDSSKSVPPEQRIKGYRYGPQVVPISTAEWEAVKFKPEKGVKLLGFTDASNIMRHYYMKDVNIFLPEPGNEKAIIAVSALARAMKESDKVAILRCVWRHGQNNVVIGVITPNVSDKDTVADSFYFNILPFAEDVREFQFSSFNNLPAALQPNEQQQEAADNFVKMLNLSPSDNEEILRPDFTPNPVLERFYRHLELKSKNPDASVPPLDETLKKITEPDHELLSQIKPVIDEFRKQFEVKDNPKLKRKRRLIREKPSGSNEENEGMDEGVNTLEYSSTAKTEIIGNLTPVQDFEAMVSQKQNQAGVIKAMNLMKSNILDLLENSNEGDKYQKALDCLVSLRKVCILQQESKHFNDCLKDVYRICKEKKLGSFSDLLSSREILLIVKSEAEDSDITEDEASRFNVRAEPKNE
jgi:ATP-dependent DNA helicase 2 subunit 2